MNADSPHLQGLNKEQREAALHTAGPLLIIAGAGAGKTKTITHRIVNLIKEGVPPEKILAVTFTNKAAREMRERIVAEIRKNSPGIWEQNTAPFVSTFHSLGVYIIRENARMLGLTRYFTILDESDSTALIREAEKELGLDPKQCDPKKIKNIISREKGEFTHLEDYAERANILGEGGSDYLAKIVARVWNLYEKKKSKENALDFDDLLLKAVKLLQDEEGIRKIYQEKWEYVHIDEYQDTNEVQYLLSKLLTFEHKNICVVGDADQNIYSFRGANLKNILSFEKDYPEAKVVLLEENYRSTKNILEAANVVIRKNKWRTEKNLFTRNKTGEKIGLYEALNETDEADFAAGKILEMADSGADLPRRSVSQADGPRGSAPLVYGALPRARGDSDPAEKESDELVHSDIAVLYRANFQSRALEEAMLRHNIPYQVLGVKFFERKEIKDTLAYLRAALNPGSLMDIKRIINFPARGIGKVTLAKIFAGEINSLPLQGGLPVKVKIKIENFYRILEEIKEKIGEEKASEVIKFAVKRSGIESELSVGAEEDRERLENIKELATLALKYDHLKNSQGIEKLLEEASLASDQDSLLLNQEKSSSGKKEGVKLMTVHAAKGLEFKYVFITGLEDGLFPHERIGKDEPTYAGGFGEAKEEERRLFYVALTRAKEKLFLSFANFRTIFGSRVINAPSEFLADIPMNLLQREGAKEKIKIIYI